MASFGSWLARQQDRKDEVGMLAQDVLYLCPEDCPRCFPKRPWSANGILAELIAHEVSEAKIEAFHTAFGEWQTANRRRSA